jgi:hypothetical protein
MDINKAFPSQWLTAGDIGEAAPIVTISHVEFKEVGQAKEVKPVLFFEGKQKGMVCNKTNAKTIAQIAGDSDTDNWAGTRVQLYVAVVSFQGEEVEALRVRVPKTAPKPKPEPAADLTADEIPF